MGSYVVPLRFLPCWAKRSFTRLQTKCREASGKGFGLRHCFTAQASVYRVPGPRIQGLGVGFFGEGVKSGPRSEVERLGLR